jgi:exosortase/archaeosortase family protein
MAWLRLTDAQRFGARFFVILVLASVFSWAVALPNHLRNVQRAIAMSATGLAQLVGSSATLDEHLINIDTLTIDINYECTGVYVLLVLFTFLLAYPASWQARVLGALIGTVALTLLNVLRISLLIRVAEFHPQLFDYLHEYVWQGLFLVLVVGYAMAWVQHVRR